MSRSKNIAGLVTASAGNHGIGLAWACHRLHLPCHVFLAEAVAEKQAERIRAHGAVVHRVAGAYEDSLAAARSAVEEHGWAMVQDVDWEGYTAVPRDIFAGYTVLAGEIVDQLSSEHKTTAGAAEDEKEGMMSSAPTHVIVNAGVGGLASAVCAHFWARYGADRPVFVTAEPTASDCLLHSGRVGRLSHLPIDDVVAKGRTATTTVQTGLDCKVPAPLAWSVLATGVDAFVAVPDDVVAPCIELLATATAAEPETPPVHAGESAVAGLGVLVAAAAQPAVRQALALGKESKVVIIACEGAIE